MPKRVLQGTVVSDTNDKTVVVRVDRAFTHPVMKKTVRRSKKYHAHDEANSAKVGDTVWIEECPPISKNKRCSGRLKKVWSVVRRDRFEREGIKP
jgi:small subunit ribosomal protein S17